MREGAGLFGEVGLDSLGGRGQHVLVLLAAGFDRAQQRFHEAAVVFALRAEAQLTPDHGMSQTSLSGVVGRFDAVGLQERPQPVAMTRQLPAHAIRLRSVAAARRSLCCELVRELLGVAFAKSFHPGICHTGGTVLSPVASGRGPGV